MFTSSDLQSLAALKGRYRILVANAHDVTISSILTGHEWIVISNYGKGSCRIRHRHHRKYPFHDQRGTFLSLQAAIAYIEGHDRYFALKTAGRRALPDDQSV